MSSPRDLSPKEFEVAAAWAAGKRARRIAVLLGKTEQTVKNQLREVYRKLGVHNWGEFREAWVNRFQSWGLQ